MSGSQYPDRDPHLFYELARDRHAAQAALLDSLDAKLVVFLSSSSALLSILVAVYALRPNVFEGWELALPTASGAAWVAITGFALDAFRARGWRSGPKLAQVFSRQFSDEDDVAQKWQVANHFWHDYNDNKPLEDRKSRAIMVTLRLFVIQTLLLVAALLLVARAESETTYRSQTPMAVAHARMAPSAPLVPARVVVLPV